MTREEEGGVLTAYKNAETPPKGGAAEKKDPGGAAAVPAREERDVWKALSEISAKLDLFSDRALEQNEAIDRLLGLLEAKAAESKKGTLLDQFQVFTNAGSTTSIWTTMVDLSLYEDINDKLGIDQDIEIVGTPEYVCVDPDCL